MKSVVFLKKNFNVAIIKNPQLSGFLWFLSGRGGGRHTRRRQRLISAVFSYERASVKAFNVGVLERI